VTRFKPDLIQKYSHLFSDDTVAQYIYHWNAQTPRFDMQLLTCISVLRFLCLHPPMSLVCPSVSAFVCLGVHLEKFVSMVSYKPMYGISPDFG